jgi:predicted O-linked N-acetylglucosamine transferase (SPINDLY family)
VTPEEYLRRALALATDAPRLRELRGAMRERMRSSGLLDASGFARAMEGAYREMWARWCAAA